MTVRAINPVTGDIITNNVQFLTGVEEIRQTIETRLRLFMGEYFRDITEGTPWFQLILGKEKTLTSRDAAIKNRVINTDGVVKITAYNANTEYGSRSYNVSMSVLTKYGVTELKIEGVV